MALSQTTREKLKAAFPNGGSKAVNSDTLKVSVLYQDRVPVRGSVHISTGRVISRTEIDRRFDKAFAK